MELAKISADRWENLRKTDSVSAQEADQQTSGYKQSQGQPGRRRRQRAPPGTARRVQERLRSVFRRAHPAQRRSRRADQRRRRAAGRELFDMARSIRCASTPASRRPMRPTSRLARRPLSRCRNFPDRNLSAKVARTAEAIDPDNPHPADRSRCAQQRWPLVARLLRGGAFRRRLQCEQGHGSGERDAVPRAKARRSPSSVRTTKCSCGPSISDAITAPRLEVLGGVSTQATRSSSIPPDSLEEGQQVNVAQPPPDQQAQHPASRTGRKRRLTQSSGKATRSEASRISATLACSLALTAADARSGRVTAGRAAPAPGAGCVEDATALAAGRAQGCDPKRRVVAGLSRSRARRLRAAIACRRTSRWWRRAIVWSRRARWRASPPRIFFRSSPTDPSAAARARLRQSSAEWRAPPSQRRAAPYTQNVFTIPFSLSYEADLFGRVRRNVEAANASLQSTAADLENVQLVLTAELAADYFTLRELDAEYQVVQESVGYQRKGLDLVNNRHEGGIASGLEVAQQADAARLHDVAACPGASSRGRSMSTPSRCWWDSRRPASTCRSRRCKPRRRRFRSEFLPMCWSAGRTSPPPNARWPTQTRRSASRARLSIRTSRLSGAGGWQSRRHHVAAQRAQPLLVARRGRPAADFRGRTQPRQSGRGPRRL